MKLNKIIIIPALALIIVGTIGASVVSAHGGFWRGERALTAEAAAERFTNMIEDQAQLFGISADQMKQYWAEGLSPKEIADQLGFSQEELRAKMQEHHRQMMQERLDQLVQQGVITQAQEDQHLQTTQHRAQENNDMHWELGHGHKMGMPEM